jgi:hypothetical protein
MELAVGEDAPEEDRDVQIDHRGVDGGTLVSGSRVEVKSLAKAEITLDAQFAQVGEYDVTVARAPTTSGWKVVTDAPAPSSASPSFIVESADIQPDGWCHLQVLVEVTAPTATTDLADLHVVAKRRGAPLQRERIYQLVAVA